MTFVRTGLLDPRAERHNLCSLIPASLPSGMSPLRFEDCPQKRELTLGGTSDPVALRLVS